MHICAHKIKAVHVHIILNRGIHSIIPPQGREQISSRREPRAFRAAYRYQQLTIARRSGSQSRMHAQLRAAD